MAESSQKDYLSALPPELLHEVISYLFPTHKPDLAWNFYDPNEPDGAKRYWGRHHTLDYLAATCKPLRASVMEWAETFLRQHRDLTRYDAYVARQKGRPRANWLQGRGGLLWWTDRNCIFCGTRTPKRFAIFMNGFKCCRYCDHEHWPDKMTKTEAIQEYDLTDHHLLPNRKNKPHISAKKLAKIPPGLPELRYGTTLLTRNAPPTTHFLREDVVRLATLAHGDLEVHMTQRNTDRQERSRKIRATMQRKMHEEARQRAQTAGE